MRIRPFLGTLSCLLLSALSPFLPPRPPLFPRNNEPTSELRFPPLTLLQSPPRRQRPICKGQHSYTSPYDHYTIHWNTIRIDTRPRDRSHDSCYYNYTSLSWYLDLVVDSLIQIYNVRKKDALRCSVSVMDIASEEIEKKLSMYGQFRTVYLIRIYVVWEDKILLSVVSIKKETRYQSTYRVINAKVITRFYANS